ncbi:MAG TPA: ATP-binding protein [Burkholderiaceae bacterium]|nr:ATP-binding protein [Burkholderiaceae bacterium]
MFASWRRGSRSAVGATLAAWALIWLVLVAVDGRIELGNQALLLVLGSAVAALWSGPWVSIVVGAAAVLAFNVAFVPPRGELRVDLHQHALLLFTMLSVSWIITLLVARLRGLARQAQAEAARSDELRRLAEALRLADEPAALAALAAALRDAWYSTAGAEATVLIGPARSPYGQAGAASVVIGPAGEDELTGLRLCHADGRAMGLGTGRHEEQPGWYLPLHGRQGIGGAAFLRLPAEVEPLARWLRHAQAMCDQVGLAIERSATMRAAIQAREQAQLEGVRNTLLAAIAHDHRTPLATILGASTALHDQGERMSPQQRRQLAATIADEASQLARLTDNTLQWARLGGANQDLRRDWESIEEVVGTVIRRSRQRRPEAQVMTRLQPGLPLLFCDAVLLVQLLDNLLDNALRHGAADQAVEIHAWRAEATVTVAVRDRGPGVPVPLRERVFEPYRQGLPTSGADPSGARSGAGIGLALCRAIALSHGGALCLREREGWGASFELELAVETGAPLEVPLETEGPRP